MDIKKYQRAAEIQEEIKWTKKKLARIKETPSDTKLSLWIGISDSCSHILTIDEGKNKNEKLDSLIIQVMVKAETQLKENLRLLQEEFDNL